MLNTPRKTNYSPNKKSQLLLEILLLQLKPVDAENPFKTKSPVELRIFFTQGKIAKTKNM